MAFANVVLVLLLSATAAAATKPSIGRVEALEGDVRILRDGVELRAQRESALQENDTLRTGAEAWALLAMSDGASITLRPATQLRFATYRYSADGLPAENAALLSLTRGALRSITGYIGKTHRSGYQVRTPAATIGIRGTDHEPAYFPPPGFRETAEHPPGAYDKVNSGRTVIRSERGVLPVRRGQIAFVPYDNRVRPRLLGAPPSFYRRHAEIDTRAAPSRVEFHRTYQRDRKAARASAAGTNAVTPARAPARSASAPGRRDTATAQSAGRSASPPLQQRRALGTPPMRAMPAQPPPRISPQPMPHSMQQQRAPSMQRQGQGIAHGRGGGHAGK